MIDCDAMKANRGLAVLAISVGVLGCGPGLPATFNRLTLEGKVEVYGKYLDKHINSQESARLSIASHGGAAARLMAKILLDKRSNFSNLEAIMVIDSVQTEVCSLRATPVPQALQEFLSHKDIPQAEYSRARTTLDEIWEDSSRPLCK